MSASECEPSVLVAIVNYRTAALVVDCLASLAAEMKAHPSARVVVVDNASGDNSCHRIDSAIRKRGWSRWARLVVSPINGGFAQGNNRAVAADRAVRGPADLVWLLNPDTRARPGAMKALIEFMRAHPRAGIAGTLLEDRDGHPWPYTFRFPSLLGEIERGARLGLVSHLLRGHAAVQEMGSEAEPVDWVSGASMMIRRDLFDAIGAMDERYFLYYEETDFCLQAQRAGWECWYVPQARVLHIAGQSTGVTGKDRVIRRMPAYWFESRRHYFLKNHGRLYAIAADLCWILAHLLWRLRRRMQALADGDPQRLLEDFVRHSALLKGEASKPPILPDAR
ncbi:glycosyltransferase family 2 protein [Rhizorhapis sp.]|uniref:glycosyltransferase family 2 protein n=1 Tax=Rhizorhapis sp. TaxID=1968842 RepID=UPI002B4812DE|nr:glycosyltransferase family 2 protein [Rhizorhapis sp.]HKR16557.1 glycosyltransferase family 2 protein [Rhizorhapis sp.]